MHPSTCEIVRPSSLLYNRKVKSWDCIIIGGGVIGLSLARRLRSHGLRVLLIEKHEPASEATSAAGGMLANCDPHTPALLGPLADASAQMYPDFVRELEHDSGGTADLRDAGTIAWFDDGAVPRCPDAQRLDDAELSRLEPSLLARQGAWLLPERCVDPRSLARVLYQSARIQGVDFVTGSPAIEVIALEGRAAGVATTHAKYSAGIVVNCAGAWAGQIRPLVIPTRPVKGQMVCLVPQGDAPHARPLLQHVLRAPEIYSIPRSDGRIVLGSTVEEAGFDKRVDAETIQKLFHAGIAVAPALASMRIHDAWAGLRPGSPDNLPILGETSLPRYFAATGHFRDGILLAPITALLLTQLICGTPTEFDLAPFSPQRFG